MTQVHLSFDWQRTVERLAARQVKDAANEIADAARLQGITVGDVDGGKHEIPLPVKVYGDDDNAAAVVLAHPAGIAVQAKHGTLTRAAASKGFEVHG